MHLGIIIPLKSKQTSKNWLITCNALERTLRSLLNQTLQNYTALVCGHEKPSFLEKPDYANIEFLGVDFSPPFSSANNFTQKDYELDKNHKIVKGLKAMQGRDIQYWYQLDSDDLVHNGLIDSLQELKSESGALLEGGYIYYMKSKRHVKSDCMSIYCGSTSILATDLLNLPEKVTLETMKDCPWARLPHMKMLSFYADIEDRNFKLVTDELLVYMLDSGDNISNEYRDNKLKRLKSWIKPYLKGEKPNSEFKKAFSFDI